MRGLPGQIQGLLAADQPRLQHQGSQDSAAVSCIAEQATAACNVLAGLCDPGLVSRSVGKEQVDVCPEEHSLASIGKFHHPTQLEVRLVRFVAAKAPERQDVMHAHHRCPITRRHGSSEQSARHRAKFVGGIVEAGQPAQERERDRVVAWRQLVRETVEAQGGFGMR